MSNGKRSLRTDAKGRKLGDAKHVRLYWWMFECPAYRALSCYARSALHELMFAYNGANNGDVPGSGRWLSERLGCSLNPAQKALNDLQAAGFIRATRRGHLGAHGKAKSTLWHLTMFPGPNGEPETKDFMSRKNKSPTHLVSRTDSSRESLATENAQNDSPRESVEPVFDPPTDSSRESSIVNHGGGPLTPARNTPDSHDAGDRVVDVHSTPSSVGPSAKAAERPDPPPEQKSHWRKPGGFAVNQPNPSRFNPRPKGHLWPYAERERFDLSVPKLARMSGVSPATIGNLEYGRLPVSRKLKDRVARALEEAEKKSEDPEVHAQRGRQPSAYEARM